MVWPVSPEFHATGSIVKKLCACSAPQILDLKGTWWDAPVAKGQTGWIWKKQHQVLPIPYPFDIRFPRQIPFWSGRETHAAYYPGGATNHAVFLKKRLHRTIECDLVFFLSVFQDLPRSSVPLPLISPVLSVPCTCLTPNLLISRFFYRSRL